MVRLFPHTSELNHLLSDLTFAKNTQEAELVIVGSKPFEIDSFPSARAIFRTGVGVDNIDTEILEKRGVRLFLPSDSTREIIFEETAAYATHLILCSLYDGAGDFPSWKRAPRDFIRKKEVLVLGVGNIGSRVVRNLNPIVQVETFDPLYEESHLLAQKIATADTITLHFPLNGLNSSFIDIDFLSKMKPKSAIVNTARGALIDEEALCDALATGRVRAYLDVFANEPYSGPLLAFQGKGLTASPHVSSFSQDFLLHLAQDLRDIEKGMRSK